MNSQRFVAGKSALLVTKLQFLLTRLQELQADETKSNELQAEIRQELKAIEQDVAALLKQLRPHRIAIAGLVSGGKSTFVNKALVNGKLVATGRGRTTTLPVELAFRGDSDKYRVAVEFVDESSLRSLLTLLGQWELRMERNESPDAEETKQINAAKHRLMKLFSNVEEVLGQIRNLRGGAEVPSLVLRETEATARIGGPAEVEEVESISMAWDVIGGFSSDPWIWVVRSIRVEGPFEFIPAGVVVVDTPGLGDPDVVISERTQAQLALADEVWHLSPRAQSFAVDLEQMAVVRSLTEGGESRTVRVVVTKCRDGLDDDDDGDNDRVASVRRTLVESHRRGKSEESMTADERRQWDEQRPAIEERVNAMPLAFTDFGAPVEGVDTVHGWLQALSDVKAESLGTVERAFATIERRLEDLLTQTVRVPAPCTAAELAAWHANVSNAVNQLTTAMNALPWSLSDDSYHRMVSLNRWAIDPAARTGGSCVHWKTGIAVMRKYGHHITTNGTRYDLTSDIINRYSEYMRPMQGWVTALRNAALSLDANDDRYAAARASLWSEFATIEYNLFGGGSYQWHVQQLRPLYERYSNCDLTWFYNGCKVRFFQAGDINFAPTYRTWIQQYVAKAIALLNDIYNRLVTPIDVTIPVPAAFRALLDQVRGITDTPPAVAANDLAPPASVSYATMTAAVVAQLRREVEEASSTADVDQLTASASRMVLGPVAAPPAPQVLGSANGPTPVPVPVPVPAPGPYPSPVPAAAGASVPPPAPRK